MRPVEGLRFDWDGTLLDTTCPHVATWWQALHGHGHALGMGGVTRDPTAVDLYEGERA